MGEAIQGRLAGVDVSPDGGTVFLKFVTATSAGAISVQATALDATIARLQQVARAMHVRAGRTTETKGDQWEKVFADGASVPEIGTSPIHQRVVIAWNLGSPRECAFSLSPAETQELLESLREALDNLSSSLSARCR